MTDQLAQAQERWPCRGCKFPSKCNGIDLPSLISAALEREERTLDMQAPTEPPPSYDQWRNPYSVGPVRDELEQAWRLLCTDHQNGKPCEDSDHAGQIQMMVLMDLLRQEGPSNDPSATITRLEGERDESAKALAIACEETGEDVESWEALANIAWGYRNNLADEVARLEGENERLRDSLEAVAMHYRMNPVSGSRMDAMNDVATAALSQLNQGEGERG